MGADGSQVGIVTRDHALAEARKSNLDLVLVAPNSEPPVAKVLDYGKHLYDLKKQKAAQRKKQKQIQVKEIRFRPGTDEGDYQVKLRKIVNFLEDGDKAKVTIRFRRGRELIHPELGTRILQRVREDVGAHGTSEMEGEPKLEGQQMTMVLAPAKRKR